jgi:hypothetical protein
MTESEWLQTNDIFKLIPYVSSARLFACGCIRMVASQLRHGLSWSKVLNTAEMLACGKVKSEELETLRATVAANLRDDEEEARRAQANFYAVFDGAPELPEPHMTEPQVQLLLTDELFTREGARRISQWCRNTFKLEDHEQAWIIRELTENPFRLSTVDPSWLTSDVLNLAEGILRDYAFDRMPILGDALQDAGCDNDDILNHCRQPGKHVRGCWVVDLFTVRRRFPIRISAETVAKIKRAVSEDEVFVLYHHWQPQTWNEGYNVLLGLDQPPGKWDEVPLDHLIGQVVPVYENGIVVLSCFPGGFAYIGSDGEFLRMQAELPSAPSPSDP